MAKCNLRDSVTFVCVCMIKTAYNRRFITINSFFTVWNILPNDVCVHYYNTHCYWNEDNITFTFDTFIKKYFSFNSMFLNVHYIPCNALLYILYYICVHVIRLITSRKYGSFLFTKSKCYLAIITLTLWIKIEHSPSQISMVDSWGKVHCVYCQILYSYFW